MSHSLSNIWIHSVWATKNRYPFITNDIETILYEQIKKEFSFLKCPLLIINGIEDHVHILYKLHPEKANSNIIKHIKGCSSHWVNEQQLMRDLFSWQVGYASFSVSENALGRVEDYIKNQKKHHKKVSFLEEREALMKSGYII
jgi:REP element-mobilizing transposase RayT